MAAKDLLEFIDWSQLESLNEDPSHPAANALKQGYREDDGLFLSSSEDEQLLLNIHFNSKVRIHSISIKGPAEQGPRSVKLFVNRASFGFSDAESEPPAAELQLGPKELTACEPMPLKLTKFNSVTVLSVFVHANQSDAEQTQVFKIALAGQALDSFNVAEIKKQEEGK